MIERDGLVRDEEQFPTVRFQKCKACGEVYTGSLSGQNTCPKCHTSSEKVLPEDNRFKFIVSDGRALITVMGTVYKIQELEELKEEIDRAVEADIVCLAFVFEGTSFLSSSIINLLVKTVQTLSLHGKNTYVITEDLQVLESLHMMNLDQVLRVLPNLETYFTVKS